MVGSRWRGAGGGGAVVPTARGDGGVSADHGGHQHLDECGVVVVGPRWPPGYAGSRLGEGRERPWGQGGDQVRTWINCKGLDATQCMEKCAEVGAPCAPRRRHPNKADGGWGDLFNCKNGQPTHVCSYSYSNGDDCMFFSLMSARFPVCVYTGGKR
jgi:hypothetical protein